ncbi:MAG: GPW/gp25 family protein [Crocinitomicaceae bacterium]|nr:GPW/gp25 family protein [Crocinitomicaceae bacterium]
MEKNNSFLGRGWKFPPEFNKNLKETAMSAREVDIEESLQIILSTRIGERIMQPDFGCNLQELLFAPINLTTITYIKDLIESAILYYEHRISLNFIDISLDDALDGIVLIELDFMVRSTNSRRNLVYPFYRGEGTDV